MELVYMVLVSKSCHCWAGLVIPYVYEGYHGWFVHVLAYDRLEHACTLWCLTPGPLVQD